MMTRRSLLLLSAVCVALAAMSLAGLGAQITSVGWDANLGVAVVQFDTFPTWGGWRMFVDNQEYPLEGGDGFPVARPNAPIAQGPTGLLIGTTPWVSALPSGVFPNQGTLQFEIPGQGKTNAFSYDISSHYGLSTSPGPGGSQTVGGTIHQNTEWSGDIVVETSIFVPSGVILTITPGTKVRFTPYRGYTNPGGRLSMRVEGTLRVLGTANDPVWFTSAATQPINGDWSMLRLVNASAQTEIRFAIFEFAQQGLNMWNSSPTVSDVIVRWNNWEGIYLESYCKPTIERARIYQNGYNGIAMEQYNDATIRDCYIADSGTHGIHVDASTARVETCIITGNGAAGLSVDNHGTLVAEACRIENNSTGIQCGEGNNALNLDGSTVFANNQQDVRCSAGQQYPIQSFKTAPTAITFPLADLRPYDLGYTPSDRQLDQFNYIYPFQDETRSVINRIGSGLGLTWSVAWDGEAVWTATLWGNVYRLHPESGGILDQWQYPGPQAWGMTFDGTHLWINDFAEKKVYEMTTKGQVVSSFLIPDTTGGAKGITWDGEALCIMGWTSSTIYRVDRSGQELNRIQLQGGGGGIAWDGSAFWIPGGRGIQRVSPTGTVLGYIHACSEGTWDLTWDGNHLWATQRTNENWFDEKLYQISVIKLLQ